VGGTVDARVRPGDEWGRDALLGLGRPYRVEGGTGTGGRGPAPARAYGGVRRRTARRSARGRVLERESVAGVAMC
jgi:hypothetical protein